MSDSELLLIGRLRISGGFAYDHQRDRMLEVLLQAGFHAFTSDSSIEVCCRDLAHAPREAAAP